MRLRQNQVRNICAIVEESKNKNKKISNSNKKKPTCIFLIVIGILHINYAKKIKKGEKIMKTYTQDCLFTNSLPCT